MLAWHRKTEEVPMLSIARSVLLAAGLAALVLAAGILGAGACLAQSGRPLHLSVESTLDLDFGQDDKDGPFGVHEVVEVERRLLALPGRPLTPITWRMDYLVLEVEIRRQEEIGSKGVIGTVKATAWRYGPAAERKKLYTVETPGRNLYVKDNFLVTEDFSDAGPTDWRRFFFLWSGAPAFEGFGNPPEALFTGSRAEPDHISHRFAGFTPWTDDMPPVEGIDGGIVGLLTYMDSSRVLARALLVLQDRAVGNGLAYMTDEHHELDFVSQYKRMAAAGDPMETPAWKQMLRLRFKGSNFDLYIPVKEDGFVIDEPLQGLPPGFRLIPYTPEQQP